MTGRKVDRPLPCRHPRKPAVIARRLLALVALALLVPCAPACARDKKIGPPGGNPQGPHFTFGRDPADQPVVSSGTAGWPIFPADPAVVKDAEGYHLFYTTYFCKANGNYYYSWDAGNLAACNIIDAPAGIGYAFSSDGGYNWEFRGSPVLLRGDQPWNRGDVETAHVAVLGDTLYLFYSAWGEYQGQPLSHRYQIGVATLDLEGKSIRQRLLRDGAVFTGLAEPLLSHNEGGEFHQNEKINLFWSVDGVDWSGPDVLLSPGASFDKWGMMAPTVVVEDSELVLFYSGWSIEGQGSASPPDGCRGMAHCPDCGDLQTVPTPTTPGSGSLVRLPEPCYQRDSRHHQPKPEDPVPENRDEEHESR